MLNLEIEKGKNIDGCKDVFRKELEDVFTKPEKPKIVITTPNCEKPIPLPWTKMPKSLQKKEDNTIGNIIKDVENLFTYKNRKQCNWKHHR